MLHIAPITLKEANAFVATYHRHHGPTVGHKFSIACVDDKGTVRGVVIAGRPVSRYFDNGSIPEVSRLCTDGAKNACSMLYAAAWRTAKAMGYTKMITYILESESGVSLKAAGWKCAGMAGGLQWSGSRCPAVPKYPAEMKIRYEIGG